MRLTMVKFCVVMGEYGKGLAYALLWWVFKVKFPRQFLIKAGKTMGQPACDHKQRINIFIWIW